MILVPAPAPAQLEGISTDEQSAARTAFSGGDGLTASC
jgi:hypothetical protein